MNAKETTFLDYDRTNIALFQQMALQFIFDNVDLNKVAFCGGIADYVNLREYYDMDINDIDLMYENERDLHLIMKKLGTKRYISKFYKTKNGEALVHIFRIGKKVINIDSFLKDFSKSNLVRSALLGHMIWHSSFEDCKKNHNDEIPLKISEESGLNYDWKRLYKHSRKAGLYNNVKFLEEKNLIDTIKRTIL